MEEITEDVMQQDSDDLAVDGVREAVRLGLQMKRENEARKAEIRDHRATSGDKHFDDMAVDRFAAAMKVKLAQKRAEGRGGWNDKAACSNEYLSGLLRDHVEKGDPVDVGNLAMMIHQRGERVADAIRAMKSGE